MKITDIGELFKNLSLICFTNGFHDSSDICSRMISEMNFLLIDTIGLSAKDVRKKANLRLMADNVSEHEAYLEALLEVSIEYLEKEEN